MKKLSRLVLLITLLFGSIHAQVLDRNLKRGFDSIKPMDTYNYCKTMASGSYTGRFTGNEGYTAVSKWAAQKFKEWGLKPIDKRHGYLQPFPTQYTMVDEAEMTLMLKEGEESREVQLELEKDFLPLLSTDSGDRTAPLVFAGWGVSAPEMDYDDYQGIDVQGKFVLCFRGVPDRREAGYRKHDEHRHRMKTAKEKGALGIFYIYSNPIANPNMDWIEGFTNAIISEKVADQIFKERDIQATDLRGDLLKYKRPLSFSLSSEVMYRVRSRHFPDGTGYNVVGYLEGSDPKLKNECFVIGGHFDHCGEHVGLLFPGANDNGSGSAVVMEMAEAFAKLRTKPKRSVVFALFGGEESGLKGSYYFVDNVPGPFSGVDAMFNFDMVGEGDGARCSYTFDPPDFKKIFEDSDEFVHILKTTRELRGPGGGSDYAPFYQKGITCATFSSNGPHLFYHQSGDTIYRLNPDIMADIARLAFLAAYQWADR